MKFKVISGKPTEEEQEMKEIILNLAKTTINERYTILNFKIVSPFLDQERKEWEILYQDTDNGNFAKLTMKMK